MCDICDQPDSYQVRRIERAVEAVGKGIEWLNNTVPGWVEKVDLTRLALTSTTDCILGQIFRNDESGRSGYDIGEDRILEDYPRDDDWNTEENAYTLGFSTHDSNWVELQNEWTKQVRLLQSM